MVVKSKFLLGKAEKALKIGVSQNGYRDDISAAIVADVDGEMSLGNAVVCGRGILLSAKAGAALDNLLESSGFWNGHFRIEN